MRSFRIIAYFIILSLCSSTFFMAQFLPAKDTLKEPPPADEPFLVIPSLGIRTAITTLPLDGGSWATDPDEPLPGHLQGTVWLDDVGNIVLSGHAGLSDGNLGIFHNLDTVELGDDIFLQDVGITKHYVVVSILSVSHHDVRPLFPTDFNQLTLLTCHELSSSTAQGNCDERLVIVADEVPL